MNSVNSDIAYSYIRERILNGHYKPGQALITRDLSSEIGVSRTPVRDALRQLESDGLVDIKARIGASVKKMEAKEFREIRSLRLALESYAAGQAAELRSAEELREMNQANEAMRILTEKVTLSAQRDEELIEALRREDVRFHISIIGAARNDVLKKEVLRLHIVSRVVAMIVPVGVHQTEAKAMSDLHRKDVQREHDEIYRAIRDGDALAAKTAMEKHISDASLILPDDGVKGRELSEDELKYMT